MTNNDINITPGKIIALWRMLLAANNYKGAKIEDLYRSVLNSSVMGGGLPLKSGIQIALNYEFLIPKDYKFFLSPYSVEELLSVCQDTEPSYLALRKIYYHIIRNKFVPWIIYFNLDVELFKISIPNNWLELLEMANLLNFQDENVQDWWHLLIKTKSEVNEAKLKTIGDIGEKLTYKFEIDRINKDGISESDKKVVWVSHISDEYGFDILSLTGKLLKQKSKTEHIYIEVKASELSNPKLFTFFISENEWNKAKENSEYYYFFCWPGIKIKKQLAAFDKPFIIPSKEIADLLPNNSSKKCQWVKCRVSIDLSEYSLDI